ncbi:MAG: hypothetical protein DRJ37_02915 [Thermoprotei archaeon]|nr:MAG: hypothetical protein DRJ37_02915 [Thermoprotei archaeon]
MSLLQKKVILLTLVLLVITATIRAIPYQKKVNVRGRLVNIEGRPILNAIVEVYRGDTLILRTETGVNGDFSFYVEREAILIKILARGYEYKEIKIDLSLSEAVTYRLGEIKLDYGLRITPSGNKFKTRQGEILNIPLTISNNGYEVETCLVEVETPEKWRAELTTSEGLRVEGFSIEPGDTNFYNLVVYIPRTAQGCYRVTLILLGVFTYEVPIDISVEKKEWRLIEAEYIDALALRGSEVVFDFRVVNNLGESAMLELLAEAPEDWRVEIKDQDGRAFSKVFLEPEQSIEGVLRVKIPPEADYGKDIITLKACGLGVCSSINFTVNVVEGYDDIQLSIETPFASAYAGSTARFKIKVRNEGLSGAIVSFELKNLPETYTYTLRDKNGNIIGQMYLESGGEEEVEISIPVPVGAEPGFIRFTLVAKGETSMAKSELGINILGKYELRILTENFYMEATAGSKEKFYLNIKNTGYNAVSNIKVTIVSVPKNLEVEVDPKEIPVLMPGETGRFVLVISVSPEATAGDYFVEFKVEAEDISIIRLLRVSVRQRGEIAYIGLIMIVLVIIVLAFFYRRYGRR